MQTGLVALLYLGEAGLVGVSGTFAGSPLLVDVRLRS